jgi:hypothetical protein
LRNDSDRVYFPFCSQKSDRLAHSGLDMDTLEIVPLLLQKRGKEIESHDNVLSDLLIIHALVSGSNVQAGDLLELPLDGSSNVIELLGEWLSMGYWLWESSNSVKNWSENDWDLLDKRVGGEKERELLGPSLDKLLVLVELLEVVKGGDLNSKVCCSGFISVLLISDEADLQVWSWDVWKSDSTNETLIFHWVVIFESDLELDSLCELSLLGGFSHLLDAIQNESVCDL